ncbi:unnamed protein product [Camellia sinensis]
MLSKLIVQSSAPAVANPGQPAVNTLREVEAFLTENPTEILTIIIEDYVQTPKRLINLFTNAGLDKYWFPVSKMPQKGEDWPTVTAMVQENHRLLIFTSIASKEAEGVAYQWNGDNGVVQGSCPKRKESRPLNSRGVSLFLENYFCTDLVQADACKEHSAILANMVGVCYKAAGNVMPNFLVVDFYMRSYGGGVFDALDRMNGQALCGCSSRVISAPTGSGKTRLFELCIWRLLSRFIFAEGRFIHLKGALKIVGFL